MKWQEDLVRPVEWEQEEPGHVQGEDEESAAGTLLQPLERVVTKPEEHPWDPGMERSRAGAEGAGRRLGSKPRKIPVLVTTA